MPATYEPIATTTLGSDTNSITFSSISSAYTDLRLVVVCTVNITGVEVRVQLNNDTASNYSNTQLTGNGSTASSNRYAATYFQFIGSASSTVPNLGTMDLFSYAGSTFKTVLTTWSGDRNGSGTVERTVSLWRSTSAISTVKVSASGSNTLSTGTTATLYGILKA
jgi:hypothetical protein